MGTDHGSTGEVVDEAFETYFHSLRIPFRARNPVAIRLMGTWHTQSLTIQLHHVTWKKVAGIAADFYDPKDRSLMAFGKAVTPQERMKAILEPAEIEEPE